MSGSVSSLERVRNEAERLGLAIEIKRMDESTRTAEDAAAACGCTVARIVKSLVFLDASADRPVLVLVSGDRNADTGFVAQTYGLNLTRCDARRVRDETGFAIGGVAPIGHLNPISVYMDRSLLDHETVWCAAGRPDSVFNVSPTALRDAIGCTVIEVRSE